MEEPPQPRPSPSPGTDTVRPRTPTDLRVCGADHVGAVPFCWNPATDDVGVVGYDVYRQTTEGWVKIGTTTDTSYWDGAVAGGQEFTYRIVARDAAGNTSAPSEPITRRSGTGLPSPSPTASPGAADAAAPTAPQWVPCRPPADHLGAYLCWRRSTDDVGVTAYDVYRRDDIGFVKIATHVPTDPQADHVQYVDRSSAIQPGRVYAYRVVARDAAGNTSRPSVPLRVVSGTGLPSASPTPTPGTPSPSPVRCTVSYLSTGWDGGFTATIALTNNGTKPLTDWTFRFAFPLAAQQVTSGWNGTWQSGEAVAVTPQEWNATVAPGATVWLGFNGSGPATPQPTAFTVDEWLCTAAD